MKAICFAGVKLPSLTTDIEDDKASQEAVTLMATQGKQLVAAFRHIVLLMKDCLQTYQNWEKTFKILLCLSKICFDKGPAMVAVSVGDVRDASPD